MLWLICNDCGRTFAPDEGLLPGNECPSDDCPSHDDEEQQMKIKTNELSGRALDWAVAKCEGINQHVPDNPVDRPMSYTYRPSTDWPHGGPVIERERITISTNCPQGWIARLASGVVTRSANAPTPLVAAMRAYVASKLGDVVDVPKELTK